MSHVSGNKPKASKAAYYLHEPYVDKYGKQLPRTVEFPQKPLATKRRGGPGNQPRDQRIATMTKAQRLTLIQGISREKNGQVRCSDGRIAYLAAKPDEDTGR